MKKNIIRLGFVIITIISVLVLNQILFPRTSEGIKQSLYMYSQPKDTVDVAFLGSSHTYCHINTALLWEEYGISGYNYAAAEQPLWNTYYYLKEICKYQSPKLVVVDLFVPAVYQEDYHYNYIYDNLYGFRFSIDKINMMRASMENDKFINYFPAFFDYHNNYENIDADTIREAFLPKSMKANYKGYEPFFNVEVFERPNSDTEDRGGFSDKSREYLQRIIDYCNENSIKLMLVVNPYTAPNVSQNMVFNEISDMAKEEGIFFKNYNNYYDEIGIDFNTDFNDISHLNYYGSCKYTRYLAEELINQVELEDHRGDSQYASWDEHVKDIANIVSNNK